MRKSRYKPKAKMPINVFHLGKRRKRSLKKFIKLFFGVNKTEKKIGLIFHDYSGEEIKYESCRNARDNERNRINDIK